MLQTLPSKQSLEKPIGHLCRAALHEVSVVCAVPQVKPSSPIRFSACHCLLACEEASAKFFRRGVSHSLLIFKVPWLISNETCL